MPLQAAAQLENELVMHHAATMAIPTLLPAHPPRYMAGGWAPFQTSGGATEGRSDAPTAARASGRSRTRKERAP